MTKASICTLLTMSLAVAWTAWAVPPNAGLFKDPNAAPKSPVKIVVQKNNSYVHPPVVLGGGHALNVLLTAPPGTSITRASWSGCVGLGCGWTHELDKPPQPTRLDDQHWLWTGWSNSGQNCELEFSI